MTRLEHRKRPPKLRTIDRALFAFVNSRERLMASPAISGNYTPRELLIDPTNLANIVFDSIYASGRRTRLSQRGLVERHQLAEERVARVIGETNMVFTGYVVEGPVTAEHLQTETSRDQAIQGETYVSSNEA